MSALPALPFHCQHFESALGEWEFLIAPPPPDLAGIVECFWISRGRVTFLHEKILLFGKAWSAASGVTEAQAKSANMLKIMGTAFVLAVVGAAVFAMFLGPRPTPAFATAAGASAGLCWVAGSFGINYLFEQRPLRLFLINGGYHTLRYTLIGLVLGLWH